MLTKKHFEAIAKIFATLPLGPSPIAYKDDLIGALARYFATDNPNFDRDRFFQACYGQDKGGQP